MLSPGGSAEKEQRNLGKKEKKKKKLGQSKGKSHNGRFGFKGKREKQENRKEGVLPR